MKKNLVTLGVIAALCAIFPLTASCSGGETDNSSLPETENSSLPETPAGPATIEDQEWREREKADKLREIFYAGGCFWGVESYFARIPGVDSVTVGYANGKTENPSYEAVCSHTTGYAETVHVVYDPELVSLQTLTEHFFLIINPVTLNQQGNDVGDQYRTGIYYTDEADLETLQSVIDEEQKKYSSPIVTELLPLQCYYLAEEYHQDYLEKNPGGYCHIDFSSLKDFQ